MDAISEPAPWLRNPTFISSLAAVLAIVGLGVYSGKYFWVEAQFVIEVLVLTMITCTISFRQIRFSFFGGMALSTTLMALLFFLMKFAGLDMRSTFVSGFLVGPLEEILKLLPVAMVVYFCHKRCRILPNPSDFLLLGSLAGAGFSLAEKALWRDVSFPFTYGPHIGDFYFFPDALGIRVSGSSFGYIGHAAATGFIGMAVGFGLFLRGRGQKWWWVLPLAAFLWGALEHALVNGYYAGGTKALLWFGGGQLTPWIFLIFLAGVLALDFRNMVLLFKFEPRVRQRFGEICKALPGWRAIVDLVKSLRAANTLAWQGACKGLWKGNE